IAWFRTPQEVDAEARRDGKRNGPNPGEDEHVDRAVREPDKCRTRHGPPGAEVIATDPHAEANAPRLQGLDSKVQMLCLRKRLVDEAEELVRRHHQAGRSLAHRPFSLNPMRSARAGTQDPTGTSE